MWIVPAEEGVSVFGPIPDLLVTNGHLRTNLSDPNIFSAVLVKAIGSMHMCSSSHICSPYGILLISAHPVNLAIAFGISLARGFSAIVLKSL